CIADERKEVGNELRRYAELLAHRDIVANPLCLAIDLNDEIAAHALSEILVRRPDANLVDALIRSGQMRGGCEGIVGFELRHRPNGDAEGCEGIFERMKLCAQSGLDAFAGLV